LIKILDGLEALVVILLDRVGLILGNFYHSLCRLLLRNQSGKAVRSLLPELRLFVVVNKHFRASMLIGAEVN